jgi:uncharacterized protein (DUF1501 family)
MQSRRVFLKHGAFAFVSLGFAPAFFARTALAGDTAGRARRLIAIFQRGAVDGLNMIVPFGEADYYSARPSIAIPKPGDAENGALDLDGFFGLNPRLQPLKRFWDERRLAIVHACGSPDSTRSHFDAQDYMESGTPGSKSTTDGWLNRYLQAKRDEAAQHEKHPFRAVSLTQQLPRLLQGSAPAVAINQIAQFGVRAGQRSDETAAMFEAAYGAAPDRVLNGTGREAFDAMKLLKTTDPRSYQPASGVEYPPSPFGQALKQIAQLAKANVGLEVAFADVGGWDTHVNQGAAQGQLATRLNDFARSIAALATDLGDALDDTVILTMSEFGRAVSENGNRGTDHGHGNAMLAIGGGVRGGRVYGKWPGLAVEQRYERRDLAVTTDFRDVFGEIVTKHLGVSDPRPIFPGYTIQPSRFAGLFG